MFRIMDVTKVINITFWNWKPNQSGLFFLSFCLFYFSELLDHVQRGIVNCAIAYLNIILQICSVVSELILLLINTFLDDFYEFNTYVIYLNLFLTCLEERISRYDVVVTIHLSFVKG